MLIYLSVAGFNRNQIDRVERILNENNLSCDDILHKDFIKNYKNSLSKSIIRKLENNNFESFEKIAEYTCKNCINIVTYKEREYPFNLKSILDYPKVLYIKGNITDEDKCAIAVVGSRKYTNYGENAARYFTEELTKLGVTIISGMAYGIDSVAHRTCLGNNGRTIAVLGNGVDVIYPSRNKSLYEKIIENGAVISEYPLGYPSFAQNFPLRNRIISGLSKGIVVIEGKKHSGTLITARIAAEQGREVFSVPGNIDSLYSEGTNLLIRDGALPLLEIEDILTAFPDLQIKKQNNADKENIIKSLSVNEKIIYDLILSGNKDINIICEMSNFDVSYTNSLLTILEIKGLINCDNNKDFNIIKN